jgi:hypothetical protein
MKTLVALLQRLPSLQTLHIRVGHPRLLQTLSFCPANLQHLSLVIWESPCSLVDVVDCLSQSGCRDRLLSLAVRYDRGLARPYTHLCADDGRTLEELVEEIRLPSLTHFGLSQAPNERDLAFVALSMPHLESLDIPEPDTHDEALEFPLFASVHSLVHLYSRETPIKWFSENSGESPASSWTLREGATLSATSNSETKTVAGAAGAAGIDVQVETNSDGDDVSVSWPSLERLACCYCSTATTFAPQNVPRLRELQIRVGFDMTTIRLKAYPRLEVLVLLNRWVGIVTGLSSHTKTVFEDVLQQLIEGACVLLRLLVLQTSSAWLDEAVQVLREARPSIAIERPPTHDAI